MSGLHVWMNGDEVGVWTNKTGLHKFTYLQSWVDSERSRPLSLSLPITTVLTLQGEEILNFFDNLLPDNPKIRMRIAQRFSLRKATDVFALLEAIGRDCVGAIQILPEGDRPDGWDQIESRLLSDEEILGIVKDLRAGVAPHIQDDDVFRISLAGFQEKTALLRLDGRWHLPTGATPSSHIIKPQMNARYAGLEDSVANEWLCAKIIGAYGLPIANTTIETFGDETVLVVERFDREWVGGWLRRLPQEDFCQAFGIPPDLKYESDGGPGIKRCLELLAGSDTSEDDKALFVGAQLIFWFMAAIDGHAKNYSFFHRPGQSYMMTPLYDVISMWPCVDIENGVKYERLKMAMAMRGKNVHYGLVNYGRVRYWKTLATTAGVVDLWGYLLNLAERTAEVLAEVEQLLPHEFPVAVWEPIKAGMLRHAQQFLDEANNDEMRVEG